MALTAPPKLDLPEVPTRVEETEAFQLALGTATRLAQRRNQLEDQIEQAKVDAQTRRHDEEQVAAILRGDSPTIKPRVDVSSLYRELDLTEKAIKAHQSAMYGHIASKAQRHIREVHRDEHTAIMAKLTKAAPKFAAVLRELNAFHRKLDGFAVGDPFQPLPDWLTVPGLETLIKQLEAFPATPNYSEPLAG